MKFIVFILRIFSKDFRLFEDNYTKCIPECPEQFYRDGERKFSKKEKFFLKLIRAS